MTLNHRIKAVGMAVVASAAMSVSYAVPAKPGLVRYDNNGDSISVRIVGDEHHHYYLSDDGFLLLPSDDIKAELRYAVERDGKAVPGALKALDRNRRSPQAKALLAKTDSDRLLATFEAEAQRRNPAKARRAPSRVADESKLCEFPTKGSPRCLAILVQYQDVKFTLDNPRELFSRMLSEEGFSVDGATGSALDFFKASSNGQFTPQFDVYGPVTLPQPMSYYGGNGTGSDDLRPYEMLIHAVGMLDNQIDFSVYDTDNDGVIDNVYIFYAGYGEADGGPANSVWPHSWNIHDDLGYNIYLDGKLLNHYATSNELKYGGTKLAGIGVFCHEFSHVMGLPDLYSTTYTSAFTPGEWSLMDHGSYNNDSHTPPTHTAYERYCLGWIEPKELSEAANVTLRHMSLPGCYDDAYIIRTESPSEYYILENRQLLGWDSYIPGHGMLVWHIDFQPDIWDLNIVNVSKQYVDIVEADNVQSTYTVAGDAFPGTANVTAFTDDTTPSMRSWSGNRLNAPITEIKEQSGIISFMFKGGEDIFDKVVAEEASALKAGGFTASWNRVGKSTGYLLSVYTKTMSGTREVREYVDGYIMREVGDTDSFEVSGLTPATEYYYVVQATNGRFFSAESNEVAVKTLDPTLDYMKVSALPASFITGDSFTANWEPLADAEYYTVTLYSRQLGDPFEVKATFTSQLLPEGWAISSCSYDSRAAYCVEAPSLRLGSQGSSLTTANYAAGVRTLSFWYRSTAAPNANRLIVSGLVGSDWQELQVITALSNAAGGTDVTLDAIPAGVTRIKIELDRAAGTGNVCVDNVVLGYGGNYEQQPVAGQKDINVGNVSSHEFTGLEAASNYSYTVQAHNSDFSSAVSDHIPVLTATSGIDAAVRSDFAVRAVPSGVEVVSPVDAALTIYNVTGTAVHTASVAAGTTVVALPAGMYIVRVADTVAKVIVR